MSYMFSLIAQLHNGITHLSTLNLSSCPCFVLPDKVPNLMRQLVGHEKLPEDAAVTCTVAYTEHM